MAAKDELAPLIEETLKSVPSNEFTSNAFVQTFARFQEKAYVKALHDSIDHPAGPFAAVREMLEQLLEASGKAAKLKDGVRDIDMFGLPGTTVQWQRKDR